MDEKISVIVPVYKVEKFLKRCVDSILDQTYENLEVILVDDGSPDASPLICDEYAIKDSRVSVIHQKNSGLSGARNAGIDKATGKYIAFVDSDDYIAPHMYETLWNNMVNYEAQISICRLQRFSGTYYEGELESEIHISTYDNETALKNLHLEDGEMYTVAYNKLYLRSLFKNVRYPVGRLNEDEFTTYKVIDKSNKIVITTEKMYFYYYNDNSITTGKKYLLSTDIFDALDERKEYFIQARKPQIVKMIDRVYLDRIIARYRKAIESKEPRKHDKRFLKMTYKAKYSKYMDSVSGVGYRIFYYSPSIYFALLKVKGRF